jgi:hypothetical protein
MGTQEFALSNSVWPNEAPTPLYNTYEDCWRGAQALRQTLMTM